MITVTCDMCGTKLNKATNEVELELNYDGLWTIGNGGFRPVNKQLCISCATRLVNWIDNQEEVHDTKEI